MGFKPVMKLLWSFQIYSLPLSCVVWREARHHLICVHARIPTGSKSCIKLTCGSANGHGLLQCEPHVHFCYELPMQLRLPLYWRTFWELKNYQPVILDWNCGWLKLGHGNFIIIVIPSLSKSSVFRMRFARTKPQGQCILVPRAHDHSDLRQGSRALALSNTGSPRFTDFPSNLANLIGWEYETNSLNMLRKSGPARALDLCRRSEGWWLWGREWGRCC